MLKTRENVVLAGPSLPLVPWRVLTRLLQVNSGLCLNSSLSTVATAIMKVAMVVTKVMLLTTPRNMVLSLRRNTNTLEKMASASTTRLSLPSTMLK